MPLEPPPTPDELQRALARLGPARQEARRRRRRRQALIGVAGALLVAAAVGLPLGLTAGASNTTRHVVVAAPPSTARHRSSPSTPSTQAPVSTAPPSTAAPTTVPPPITAPAVGTCQPSQLSASLVHSGVAGGSAIDVIALTNSGSASCTLDGYPGLALSTQSGPTPVSVQQGTMGTGGLAPPTLVTLAPGASASFYLQYSSGTGIPGSTCPASTLAITPPGDSGQVLLGTAITPCSTPGTPVQLMVSALMAGTPSP